MTHTLAAVLVAAIPVVLVVAAVWWMDRPARNRRRARGTDLASIQAEMAAHIERARVEADGHRRERNEMRLISFAMTTAQFLDGSKWVTRRLGWKNIKPGKLLWAVEKAMGLGKGGKVRRLGVIEVVSVAREKLDEMMIRPAYGSAEVVREGFPDLTPAEFVGMFCMHMGCQPGAVVTRIEFRRLGVVTADGGWIWLIPVASHVAHEVYGTVFPGGRHIGDGVTG